jgi:DNA-binding MarR family transcriptional regulator
MSSFYDAKTYKARDSVGYLVRRAGNLMTTRVEAAFADHEITFAQWLVMMRLRDGLATTAAEIARDMCHDSGALTRVIDQLAQRGLIERTRGQEDRRTIALALTKEGLRTVNALVPTVVDLLNMALVDFTDDEASTLTRLLNKLIDGVTAAPASKAEQLEHLL